MNFQAPHRIRGSRRRGSALILAAIVAALTMAIAAPAQAAPNIGWAWGANTTGQLGDGTHTGPENCSPPGTGEGECSTVPVAVKELSGVTAVSGSKGEQSNLGDGLALLEDGTVMAWGRGDSGQLGDGAKEDTDVPVAVCAPAPEPCPGSHLSGATAIAAGVFHSLALLGNGTVMEWGTDGGGGSSDVPVAVSGLSGVKAIAAGREFSLALLENGTVEAWGANGEGQLGDGTTTTKATPVAVSGLSGVVAIAAGERHGLAVLSNGTVMAWGGNASGQLGNGTTTNSNVPVAVSKLSGVSAVAGGDSHSLALLSNGTVRAWGSNERGQLGDGSHTGPESCGTFQRPCSTTPVAVTSLTGVRAISAGGQHSLALVGGGSVLGWGRNDSGQLGDGTSTGPEPCGSGSCSTTPVAASTHGSIVGISAGEGFTLAFGPPPPGPTNLPELGRCVKAAKPKTGQFRGNNCQIPEPGTGSYNWLPGPSPNPKFSGTGTGPILETEGKFKISCAAITFDGEYTGAKAEKVTVDLIGCTDGAAKQSCQSNPAKAGEIESTEPLEGELGFIKGGSMPKAGWDLKHSPNDFSFSCGQPPESIVKASIEGSAIGQIKAIGTMKLENSIKYAEVSGKQVPERFEGGLKDTLTTRFLPENTVEQTGLKATVTFENEEAIEIKGKV